jgi:hypothetical protein
MIKNVYEILDEFEIADNKADRQRILRENATPHFLQVLKYTFDPKFQFYVKSFPKDYQEPDTFPGLRYAGIESEIRRTYLFLKGEATADKLSEEKRNQVLVQLLESFEPREANVFVNMMKKNLQTKFLTYNFVKETFPNLLP